MAVRRGTRHGWILLWVAVLTGHAQVARLPSPPHRADGVPAHPTLTWSDSDLNLLSNGGFEAGTDGWSASGARVVQQIRQIPPAEGSNVLSGLQREISREFVVPDAPSGLRLSYLFLGLSSSPELFLEPLDPPGPALRVPGSAALASGWRTFGADLSEHAGRQVRLTWRLPFTDGLFWGLDDVRLTPVRPGTRFDVWMATNDVLQLAPVGQTTRPSWPLRFLPPGRRMFWRVDTVQEGTTNTGPVWQFQTGLPGELTHLLVDPVPSLICGEQPWVLGLQLADYNGFPGFSGGQRTLWPLVEAFGEGVPAPGVVATELDLTTETVEFQNVTGETLDLSGWMVDVLLSTGATNAVRVRVPPSSSLAPGALFQVQMRRPAGAWPRLTSPSRADWARDRRAGILLRDASSNVVDCVFYSPLSLLTPGPIPSPGRPGQTRSVSAPHWQGLPVTNAVPAGQTIQRTGGRDVNSAADWVVAASTPFTPNGGLSLPFERGAGAVPVEAPGAPITTDPHGFFEIPVRFIGSGSNVVLLATAFLTSRDTIGLSGQTTPFNQTTDRCLTLELPSSVAESAGRISGAVRLRIPAPLATNLPVRLHRSAGRNEGWVVPDEIVIPAGATEAGGDLEVADNTALTGPRLITVQAQAAGFASSQASALIDDDETTTLTLELPPSVTEGNYVEGILRLARSPDRSVTVEVASDNPERLSVTSTAAGRTLRPGQTELPIGFHAAQNSLLDGPARVRVSVQFANWIPAEGTLDVADDETNTLALFAVAGPELIEGDPPAGLQVVLGGLVSQDVPVTFTVEPTGRLLLPETLTIPAGHSSAVAELRVVDDPWTNGGAPVTIHATAPGWMEATRVVLVRDNDPVRFRMLLPPGPGVVGQPLIVLAVPEAIDGKEIPGLGFQDLEVTVLGKDGRPLAAQVEPLVVTPAGIELFITIAEPDEAARFRVASGGVAGESAAMPVWSGPLPTNLTALAYDEARDRMVVVDPARPLAVVDLADGVRTETIPPLPHPTQVVVSGDGQTLYAGWQGGRELARIDLATLTVEATWPAGIRFGGEPLYLNHLLPLPGNPHSLAVLRQTFASMELVIFDGTNARPLVAPCGAPQPASLRSSLQPDRILAVLPDRLQEFRITPEGVEEVLHSWNLSLALDRQTRPGDSVFSHGLVLDGQVELVDPHLPGRVGGNLPNFLRNAVATDPHSGRLAWFQAWENSVFRVFDPLTLREVWRVDRTVGNPPDVGAMVWAGPHRWVVLINGTLLMETDEASGLASAADLSITATLAARHPEASRATVRFTLENLGSNPAPDTRLTFAFPESRPLGPEAVLLTAISADATQFTNGLGGTSYRIGTLAPGARVEVTAELRASLDGRLDATAFIGSAAADPNPANNRAAFHTDGLPPQVRLSARELTTEGLLSLEFNTRGGWIHLLETGPSPNGPWAGVLGVSGNDQPYTTLQPLADGVTQFWRVVVADP